MAKTAVLEKLTKSMTWLWQEFPWLSSDCQGALVSTASTNASICILRARFTQTQFPDDSAYDSLSCPLQDSTILTESRQKFPQFSPSHIDLSTCENHGKLFTGNNSWDKTKTSDFGTKKQRPTTGYRKSAKTSTLWLCFVISPFFSTSSFCHTAWRWQHPSDAIFTTLTGNFPQVARLLQFVKSHGEKNTPKKNRSWKSTCSQIGHKISQQWLFERDPTLAHSCTFNLIKTKARP